MITAAILLCKLEVGPGRRLDPRLNTGVVRIEEMLNGVSETELPLSRRRKDFTLDFNDGAQWESKGGSVYSDGSDPNAWSSSGESPKTANMSVDSVWYRTRFLWNTAAPPMGHNVAHTIRLAQLDGATSTIQGGPPQITFQKLEAGEWGSIYAAALGRWQPMCKTC